MLYVYLELDATKKGCILRPTNLRGSWKHNRWLRVGTSWQREISSLSEHTGSGKDKRKVLQAHTKREPPRNTEVGKARQGISGQEDFACVLRDITSQNEEILPSMNPRYVPPLELKQKKGRKKKVIIDDAKGETEKQNPFTVHK